MLKQRVITAAILIPLVVIADFVLSPLVFNFLIAVVMLMAAWEWAGLCVGRNTDKQTIYLVVMACLLFICAMLVPVKLVLTIACIWWVLSTLLVLKYPKIKLLGKSQRLLSLLIGLLVFISAWMGFASIKGHTEGPGLLMYLLVLIWVADSAAYFAGKRFGRRKLAPEVSPGKTWEGFAAAMISSVVVGYFGGVIFDQLHILLMMGVSVVTVAVSVVGDLTESILKREAGVKDSGTLLPGHGGLLDRIDSLLAAVVFFAMGLLLF